MTVKIGILLLLGAGLCLAQPASVCNVSNAQINNYVLTAVGTGKNCQWKPSAGGGATPGGSNTQVQFNDGGVFGANSGFTFDKSTGNVSMGTTIPGGAPSSSVAIAGKYYGDGSALTGLSGSGTVSNSSTAGALPYYASTGTTVGPSAYWKQDATTGALLYNRTFGANYVTWVPNNSPVDSPAPFTASLHGYNYTTYSDNVWQSGYNCAANTAPVSSHQAYCHTIESSFTNTDSTGQQMEIYDTFSHPDGTATRVFGFTPSIATGNHAIVGQFTVTDLQFYNPASLTSTFLDITPTSINSAIPVNYTRTASSNQTFVTTSDSQPLLRRKSDDSITIGPDFPLGAGTNLYPSATHTSYTMPLNFGDRKIQWTSATGFQFQDNAGTLHSFAAAESALPAGIGMYSSYRGAGSASGSGAYNEVGNIQLGSAFNNSATVDVEMQGVFLAYARWSLVPLNAPNDGNWYQVPPLYYAPASGITVYLDARRSSNVLYLRIRRGDSNGTQSATFFVKATGFDDSGNTRAWNFTSATGTGATVSGMFTSGVTTPFYAVSTTGSGTASLGTNSPAITNTAPYQWLTVLCSDGSTCYVPAWK